MAIYPVILCGGSGTRLWPRSRAAKPKPFLPLVGNATLFEATVARCPHEGGFALPIVVTGAEHVKHVEALLGRDAQASIIVEPAARNTAVAIAYAAHRLPDDAIMLVCPSDHHIGNAQAFGDAARAAAELAGQGWLVSIGIRATSPETGFGYLKRGEAIGEQGFRTAQFVEKPDLETARQFLAAGDYSWNGGIFAFRVADYLAEFAQHRPELAQRTAQSVAAGCEAGRRFYPDAAPLSDIDGESVDYAVMENTKNAAMVPADMDWSDIGNWEALHAARTSDEAGNCTRGDVELVDCRDVLVDTDGPRVSVIGLEGVLVIVDGDDVMITTREGAQKVGKLSGAAKQ